MEEVVVSSKGEHTKHKTVNNREKAVMISRAVNKEVAVKAAAMGKGERGRKVANKAKSIAMQAYHDNRHTLIAKVKGIVVRECGQNLFVAKMVVWGVAEELQRMLEERRE